VIKDADGQVVELRCTYDPATRGGDAPDGRKVKATLHWVSAAHAVPAEVRLYDRLFTVENPNVEKDGVPWTAHLNPQSLEVVTGCQLEPSLASVNAGARYQFERHGYFCVDRDSRPGALVFKPHCRPARHLGADRKARLGRQKTKGKRQKLKGGAGPFAFRLLPFVFCLDVLLS
jgi:hypothetical protein